MKVGYVGLGALGGELARRFLGGQDALHVWDVNTDALARFAALGATPARDAAELARQCDVVLICLPRSADVRQMMFGARGLAEGLRAGTLVIDQTSGVPDETRDMARQLAARDVAMLDAAVSASPHIVGEGLATLMVGGSDTAVERALPVLRTITQTIYHCGTRVGDGQAMKMVNNAMNGACRMGTLELAALGRKLGLPLHALTRVLNQSPAYNQITDKMLPAIEAGKASTNFALSLMLKDLNQAIALGLSVAAPMPVVSVTRGLMQIGLNTLGSNASLEDMIGVIEAMAGARIAEQRDATAEPALQHPQPANRIGYLHPEAAALHLPMPATVQTFSVGAPNVEHYVRACDVLLTSLDDADTKALLLAPDSPIHALPDGALLIHLGLGDPDVMRVCRQTLGERGIVVADAPACVALPLATRNGLPACLPFSAPTQDAARVQAALAILNRPTVYCGDVGRARTAAIVRDAVTSLCLAIALECISAGHKYGLSLSDMATVLHRGSGWSAASRLLLDRLTREQPVPDCAPASLAHALGLAATLAIQADAPALCMHAARGQFEAAANRAGEDDPDGQALLRHYETGARVNLHSDLTAGA